MISHNADQSPPGKHLQDIEEFLNLVSATSIVTPQPVVIGLPGLKGEGSVGKEKLVLERWSKTSETHDDSFCVITLSARRGREKFRACLTNIY